ncbi:hypothetical protein SHPE106448_18345 [Shewanella pealeana]
MRSFMSVEIKCGINNVIDTAAVFSDKAFANV